MGKEIDLGAPKGEEDGEKVYTVKQVQATVDRVLDEISGTASQQGA